MVRRFSTLQRTTLFLKEQGRCAACSAPLRPGWHADHQEPFSKGGRTDVLNGQALCPSCNFRKGNRIVADLIPWPSHVHLRRWQRQALESVMHKQFKRLAQRDSLIVATPGSGKTLLALSIAHRMLSEGFVERIVVVTPTNHLRFQWADAADTVGVHFDPHWSNADGVEADDFHGIVVTYSQVSFAPSLYRLQAKKPTLVILDEIHHAGDELRWGNSAREAFEAADYRLALSGTPFRSDNNPIPFVTYEVGRSRADFEYSYANALADGVCRPAIFPSFEGEVKWLSHTGLLEDWSLLDLLSREKEAERWRATLQPEGGWLCGVLSEADQALSAMRAAGHVDAAGLIFAIDQEHARRIALVLRNISGTEPVIAISDDPSASEQIRGFATGRAKWIICVRMISEGVDIPRLRVGVFATNISTELFFRQAVGRFVRVIDGLEEQSVQFYIPAIEPLIKHALSIEEERDHQLFAAEARGHSCAAQRADNTGDDGEAGALSSAFTPISSDSKLHEMICDGGRFNEHDLRVADQIKLEMGLPIPAAQVAALLKRGAAQAGVFVLNSPAVSALDSPPNPSPCPEVRSTEVRSNEYQASATVLSGETVLEADLEMTKYNRKKALRHETSRLANRLAGLLGFKPWQIHRQWKDSGGMPQGKATEENLLHKRDWLTQRIRDELDSRST